MRQLSVQQAHSQAAAEDASQQHAAAGLQLDAQHAYATLGAPRGLCWQAFRRHFVADGAWAALAARLQPVCSHKPS